MEAPVVLVYGRTDQRNELEALFRHDWPGAEVLFRDDHEPPPPDVRIRTDLLLYFAEEGAAGNLAFSRLKKIINRFAYLPALVVVGKPEGELWRLGASRYLDPARLKDVHIAGETLRAYRATWWHGISQINQPIMIVDRDETVIRANAAARAQFGSDLIGRPYRAAVERSGEGNLPAEHPVRKVLDMGRDPRAVCHYHEFPAPSPDANRANLVCIPIPGLSGAVRAVGVLFVGMDRWARIFQSAKKLGEADSPRQMHEAVVQAVAGLGYKRARLYQLSPDGTRLKGRASVGFTAAGDADFRARRGVGRAEHFRESFEIVLAEDGASRDALGERCFPALCICGGGPAEGPSLPSDLVRYYHQERRYADDLESGAITRWIDVPLLTPAPAGPGGVRRWGKLSVDNGADSAGLDAQDVADLTMFAAVASGHLAAAERAGQLDEQVDFFRGYAARLAEGLRTAVEGRTSFVLNLLVEMYKRLTDPDVVYFRRLDGDGLRLVRRTLRWRGDPPPDCDIPTTIRRGEGYSARLLERIDAEGRWQGSAEPLYVRDGDEPPAAPGDRGEEHWTLEQRTFLQGHTSALYIPVIAGDRLRGAIIALNVRGREFRADAATVRRFLDTAGLWYELGVLQDEQQQEKIWWAKNLEQVVAVLPKLATAPPDETDEAFFAGLATAATSHLGLEWNRIQIWRVGAPGTADLVYALGGCGEHEEQARLVEELIERFRDLGEMCDVRLADPRPRRQDGRLDPLYQLAVDQPRMHDEPIRIHFDGAGGGANPLAELLAHDYRRGPPPHLPWELDAGGEWFRHMNADYRGLFAAGKMYAFPLYCVHDDRKEPLGLVVVDMLNTGGLRRDGQKAATRLVLDLAAHILSSRRQEIRTFGMLKGLSMALHGVELKETWDKFHYRIKGLSALLAQLRFGDQKALQELTESFQEFVALLETEEVDGAGGAGDLVARARCILESRIDIIDERLRRLFSAQEVLAQHLERRARPVIPDAAAFVRRELQSFEEKGVTVHWKAEPAAPVQLPCHPLVFADALHQLVGNARAAAEEAGRAPELHVRMRLHPLSERRRFEQVFELELTDNGAGVDESMRDLIFLDGFSGRRSADGAAAGHKGKGLALARSQLMAFHGDLQLRDPGGTDADGKPHGAVFVILFGIPPAGVEAGRAVSPPTGASHASEPADR